jgi:hypothetical protein
VQFLRINSTGTQKYVEPRNGLNNWHNTLINK